MEWIIWVYRRVFCCKRKIEKLLFDDSIKYKDLVSPAELPWLWLGITNSSGQTIVATHMVADRMYVGTRVTPEYLSSITGLDCGVWKYIDAETLEEKDFHSEGFIIGKCQE